MSRKQHPVYGDPQRFEVVADFMRKLTDVSRDAIVLHVMPFL